LPPRRSPIACALRRSYDRRSVHVFWLDPAWPEDRPTRTSTPAAITGTESLADRQPSGRERHRLRCHRLPGRTFAHHPLRPPTLFVADNLEPLPPCMREACIDECLSFAHRLKTWETKFPTYAKVAAVRLAPLEGLPPLAASTRTRVMVVLTSVNECQWSCCRTSRDLADCSARWCVDIPASHREIATHLLTQTPRPMALRPVAPRLPPVPPQPAQALVGTHNPKSVRGPYPTTEGRRCLVKTLRSFSRSCCQAARLRRDSVTPHRTSWPPKRSVSADERALEALLHQ
jgi:hypothetical protein